MTKKNHTQQKKAKRPSSRSLFEKTWFYLALLAACFLFLLATRLYINHGTTGDEPHYLIMDHSLAHDHDLNLKNNYENQDYRAFYPHYTGPHAGPNQARPHLETLYSTHGIGLPILLLPGYVVAEKMGAVIEMVVLATAVVWLVWLWVLYVTTSKKLATIAAAVLTACVFFNGQAGYIYPDLLVAGFTLGALIIIARFFDRPIYQLLFGVLLGGLVLLHFKTLVLAGPLFGVLAYKLWKQNRRLPWLPALGFGAMALYFFLTLHQWFGVWNPTLIYPAVFGDINLRVSPLRTIPAMLFDSNRGLLIYNPVLILVFVGLVPWFKQRREFFVMTMVSVLPSLFLLTTFSQWQGGGSPAGRYLMAFLPAFMPALAFAVALAREKWQKVVVILLVAASLFITGFTTLHKVPYINPDLFLTRSELFAQLEKVTIYGWDRLLPTYSNQTTLLHDRHGLAKVSFGMLVLAASVCYGYYLSRSLKPLDSK